MKNIFALILVFALVSTSCRDESLNPVPKWNPGLHAFGIFDGVAGNGSITSRPQPYEQNYAKNFPATGQDAASIPLKIRWVSLDNLLKVAKIEVYVKMIEYYTDADGNEQSVDLSGGNGKLLTTIATPAANRQWNNFTVTPTQIYNLFKDATVKYDKTNAVKVFDNPKNPRPAGAWFNGTDEFRVFWKLTSTDGLVYEAWGPNLCGDVTSVSEANSNCSITFGVK